MLRKRLKELEETANKPLEVKDPEEQSQQPKHQSMAQKVYAENRVNYVNNKVFLHVECQRYRMSCALDVWYKFVRILVELNFNSAFLSTEKGRRSS